jgi:hypothetical protein
MSTDSFEGEVNLARSERSIELNTRTPFCGSLFSGIMSKRHVPCQHLVPSSDRRISLMRQA